MTERTYLVGNMTCANCAKDVETTLARLEGVTSAEVDYFSGKLRMQGDVPFEVMQARVEALGKTLAPPEEARRNDEGSTRGGVAGFWDYLLARRETRLALTGGAIVVLTFVLSFLGLPTLAADLLYTLGMVVALLPILRSGVAGLRVNRQFNINLLMSLAAVGAIVIGEYMEGALVIFLFAIGEALEGYTADRARDSIRGLMRLTPKTALRLSGEREERVSVEQLRVGDHILVKPGENIPMDGRILSGASSVNQAPITGENVPVPKQRGDELFAGTINGEGTLTVAVTRLAADNTLQRILQMVEEAQGRQAPSQRVIDRFANWYTPTVVLLAALVAIVPPLLFNAPFLDPADGSGHGWLYRALAMLVIACPCALVISTPVTVISAIARAARQGVLIKGGTHLEMLGRVRAIGFDKTGTLTEGRPELVAYQATDCLRGTEAQADCERCDDLLALAAAVERRTAHPLADAVVQSAQQQALAERYPPAAEVELLAGRGVRGEVNQRLVTLGSHALFDAEFSHPDILCANLRTREAQGQTTMLLAEDEAVRGYFALADQARPSARGVVAALNELRLTTVMLTGDHQQAASAIAREVGVSDVRSGLLPQDKVAAVEALRDRYDRVAMVGDGINDTPALAAANVGVAMGGAGSPQALESADVVLMADDLTQLPVAIRRSRFARRLIQQNVVLSFGVKIVFLALAFFGLTSLWLAILADVGMALLVTLNGMRAGRQRTA